LRTIDFVVSFLSNQVLQSLTVNLFRLHVPMDSSNQPLLPQLLRHVYYLLDLQTFKLIHHEILFQIEFLQVDAQLC
jgi:hypothetical protein